MISIRKAAAVSAAAGLALTISVGTASAHPDGELDDGSESGAEGPVFELPWGDGDAALHEEPGGGSTLPDTLGASGERILDVVGRGERNVRNATTDVWALGDYAYTGTFNSPCGGDPDAGIWVWDVHNPNKVEFVTVIPSPEGSRTNDVRVAEMHSGDILVHTNESCNGGPGGFEIYNVDDPANPVYLASVRIDEMNPIVDGLFGGVTDVGTHNLWLFHTKDGRDYVGVTSEGVFDNFQIYDITDPTAPTLASTYGAEETFDPGVSDSDDPDRVLNAALWMIDGFGNSANRFLHDVTISADAQTAYLASWDAGLITLDISDPTNPVLVSVAIDPVNGSLDGEVNSHSVWPSEDGHIVVEGEEDFSAWEATVPPSNVTFGNGNPIPGVMAATATGDLFEANQTGNSGEVFDDHVVVDSGPVAGTYPASEFSGNTFPLGDGSVSGEMVWAGRACAGDALENEAALAGAIAIVRRGACTFAEKATSVAGAGAVAIVITNNNPTSTPWSGLRIWDYSDPANPILASTFNTACSASTAPSSSCVADGTYSAHNVIVETQGKRVLAYISWYNDGVIVLDVTDPYNPVEYSRILGTNEEGVLNDFWGIYKVPNNPFIYASDRNGGLYVLKFKGNGNGHGKGHGKG